EQLKSEIRLLLKLALTNLKPHVAASANSKAKDTRSVENGLGYIGLVLENAERKISHFWDMYEGSDEIATINYPSDYKLLTEEERRLESEYLEEVKNAVPSETFKKEIQKRQAKIALGHKVAAATYEEIEKEISNADSLIFDPEIILQSQEAGLVSDD